jgi:hypothetical protein
VIVTPPGLSKPETKAVTMLVEEVEKRTQVRWRRADAWPDGPNPVVAVGPAPALQKLASKEAFDLAPLGGKGKEGYRIWSSRVKEVPVLWIAGNDARGVLFGVGRFLRTLHMTKRKISLPADFKAAGTPHYAIRGHQLGYRPKTNSYDGWNLALWEQYIRDLAVFGTNAVELIPPRSDDAADSPHFPLPHIDMMVGMSRLLDE